MEVLKFLLLFLDMVSFIKRKARGHRTFFRGVHIPSCSSPSLPIVNTTVQVDNTSGKNAHILLLVDIDHLTRTVVISADIRLIISVAMSYCWFRSHSTVVE